jgi:hypothetical protein
MGRGWVWKWKGDSRIDLNKHHVELKDGALCGTKNYVLFAWWGSYTMEKIMVHKKIQYATKFQTCIFLLAIKNVTEQKPV